MADPSTDADGLRAVASIHDQLLAAIAPFVRWEHPQARLALSLLATRPRVAHGAAPGSWSSTGGAARFELQAGAEPAALTLKPGRLAVDEGFVTVRTRCRAEGAADAAAHAAELLDAIFGFVRRQREPPPETRLDGGVLVWERPVNRCEVLLVLQRALGRPLAGEARFEFAGDRIVLHLSGQEEGRWETTEGLGVFDPWPFAIWLERRHLKLQRPALRIAIEPERTGRAAPAPATRRKAPAKRAAAKPARTSARAPARRPARGR